MYDTHNNLSGNGMLGFENKKKHLDFHLWPPSYTDVLGHLEFLNMLRGDGAFFSWNRQKQGESQGKEVFKRKRKFYGWILFYMFLTE